MGVEWTTIYPEKRTSPWKVVRFIMVSLLFILFFPLLNGNIYGQEQTIRTTKGYQVYGKKSKSGSRVVCPQDTLFLSIIIEDSSLVETFYRWEVSKDSGYHWQSVSHGTMSYLLYPNPFMGIRFRCKITDSHECADDPDCEGIISIFEPPVAPLPSFKYQVSPPECGQNNGEIVLTLHDSEEAPYSISWNNNTIQTKDLTALPSGEYWLSLTNQDGCTIKERIIVPEEINHKPDVNIEVENATCGMNNGKVTILPLNPNTEYRYEWSNGSTDSHLEGLHLGKYTLKVTDTNQCTLDTLITISNISSPIFMKEIVKAASCGLNNGCISLQISGGGKPYRFRWNTGDTTQNIEKIPPGFYAVLVTDKWGCTEEMNAIQVKDLPRFEPGFETTLPLCSGQNTGSITLNLPDKNLKYYRIQWNNGEEAPEIRNLYAGEYSVKVEDIRTGCLATAIVILEDGPPMYIETLTAQHQSKNGTGLKIIVTGGKPPYLYQINDFVQDNPIFQGLKGNKFLISVTDKDGCKANDTLEVMVEETVLYDVEPTDALAKNLYFSPNIITPNNDKSNDAFYVDAPDIKDAYIEIYDNTGRLLFSESMSSTLFVGSAEKVICPAGLYYYTAIIEFKEGENKIIKGSFKIVR